MLTAEAVWEMPPFTGWYAGAENIGQLIDTQCPGGVPRHADDADHAPTASRRSASTCAPRTATSSRSTCRCSTSTATGCGTSRAFFDTALFARFGLPAVLPADHGARRRRGPVTHGAHGRRRAAGPGPGATPGRPRRRSARTASRPTPCRDGTWPTCSPTWTTPSTPSPRRPAGRVRVEVPTARRCRGSSEPAAEGVRSCSARGAARRPSSSWSATSRCRPSCWSRTAALEITVHGWDVAPGDRSDQPDPRGPGPQTCCRSPGGWSRTRTVPSGSPLRWRPRSRRRLGARRLLGFLGRTR